MYNISSYVWLHYNGSQLCLIITRLLHNLDCLHLPWHIQGSFCKCTEPIGNDATMLYHLTLAECIYKIISACNSVTVKISLSSTDCYGKYTNFVPFVSGFHQPWYIYIYIAIVSVKILNMQMSNHDFHWYASSNGSLKNSLKIKNVITTFF